ncbi:MAG: hypothetical protein GX929_02270 [Clostridiales bacterium]|nr:hypothetical protein [Clostridiales bacterium]
MNATSYANPASEKPPVKRDRRLDLLRFLQQLMLFCMVATIVLSAYIFRADILEAYAAYRASVQLVESRAESRINFEPDSSNIFALYGNNLAVLNRGTYKLYTPAGDEQLAIQYISANPAMSVSDTYVCLYNRGSAEITVTSLTSTVGKITVSGAIISVSQNDSGCIAVLHDDDRYRSVLSVYDPQLNLIYQWKTSEYYLLTAALSPDGKTLAAVAMTQDDAVFITRVITFLLEEESYHAVCDLPGTLVTRLQFFDNTALCAIGNTRACVITTDGKIRYEFPYSGCSLRTCAFDTAACVLALVDRTSGLSSYLVSLTADREPVTLDASDVRWIDVNDGYVAILYTDTAEIRDTAFNKLSAPVTIFNVRRIFVTDGGRALVVYTSEAGVVDLVTPFIGREVS